MLPLRVCPSLVFLLTFLSLLLLVASGCPNDCSGHGQCQGESGLCHCDPLYLDWDCSVPSLMSPITVGDSSSFTFYWRLVDDDATLLGRISAFTDLDDLLPSDALDHGWAALMFGPTHGMLDGRVIRVSINASTSPPTPTAVNMYSATFARPSLDTPTTYNVTGYVTGVGIDVSFATPLLPLLTPKTRPPFSPSSTLPVSWAWGNSLIPVMSKHWNGYHGSLRLNLAEHALVPSISLAFYTPALVALCVATVLGLVMQLPMLKHSTLGRCCLHRRVPSLLACCNRRYRRGAVRVPSEEKDDHLITPSYRPPLMTSASRFLSLLTFDLLHTALSWSFGEWLLVILYLVSLLSFVVVGWSAYTDFVLEPRLLLGHLTAVHLALTLLPVTRDGAFLLIFSMPYERAVAYHRYSSRLCFLFLSLHGLTMTAEYGVSSLTKTDDLPHGDGVVWGFLTFLCICLMVLTSLSYVRRHAYELFYYLHCALFLPAVTFAAKHSTYFRFMLILPAALIVADFFRGFRRTFNGALVSRLRLVQGERDRVVLLTARVRGMKEAQLGAYVMLNAPTLSMWQWHPYSVCAMRKQADGWAEVDVCVLDSGADTWSGRLCAGVQALHTKPAHVHVRGEVAGGQKREESRGVDTTDDDSPPSPLPPSPSVSSPPSLANSSLPHAVVFTPSSSSALLQLNLYGPCSHLPFSLSSYSSLILIAGGVGITPMLHILHHCPPPPHLRTTLIWVSRNLTFFTHLVPDQVRAWKGKGLRVLMFDTGGQRKGVEGGVAKRRRVELGEGEAGGRGGEVEVYEGRPNVRRLVEWVEQEHAGGGDEAGGGEQGGEDGDGQRGGKRGGGDVEMVIRTQGGEGGEGEDEDGEEDDLSLEELDDGEEPFSEDSTFSSSVGATAHGHGSSSSGEVRQGIACVACGPMGLLDEVESACNARGIDMHREAFEL